MAAAITFSVFPRKRVSRRDIRPIRGGKRAGPTIYEMNAPGEQRSAGNLLWLVAAVEIS